MSTQVDFGRQIGFVGPADFPEALNIIGVGATGSNVALLAAKMGFTQFQIWDNDIVEAHNLPNQAYDVQHIGMPKVEALKAVLERFNPAVKVVAHNKYFTSEEDVDLLEGPLFVAVDSMKARADITKAFDGNVLVDTVFETKLGFDFGEVNVIDNMSDTDLQNWKNTLVDDSKIPEGPCGLKICATMVSTISSLVVHQICKKYASVRNNTEWKPKKKTVMALTEDGIVCYSPKERT